MIGKFPLTSTIIFIAGKALTAEFMDRWIPNLSAVKTIAFPNQRFETVLYDDSILSRFYYDSIVQLVNTNTELIFDLE